MGCHINMYKVSELSLDLDKLEQEFKESYSDQPLFYFWKNYIVGRQQQNIRVKHDAWFDCLPDSYNLCINPIKGNPELHRFRDLAFPIKYQKQNRSSFSDTYLYPLFIELQNVNCPWIRGGEYDLMFSGKDKFLKYFKEEFFKYSYSRSSQGWFERKEEYQWFGDNFISGENLIRLG